jgi:carbon-monoxide dehydrogenase large subunit
LMRMRKIQVLSDERRSNAPIPWITPSQGVRYMVRVLCDQVFKIPDERMRVLTYDVGGAFGSKEQPYPEDVALLYAARVLQRPVKWHASRSENLLSDNHARDAVIECALALDPRGRFLAIRARIVQAMGAYFGCNGPNGSLRNTPWGLPLVYRTRRRSLSEACRSGPSRSGRRRRARRESRGAGWAWDPCNRRLGRHGERSQRD